MNSMYLKMKGRKLPEERLDLLQKWINDALSLQESMAQPSPEEMMGTLPAQPTGEELPPI